MAWTLENSGSQTATIDTEHNLISAVTTNATYVLKVDAANMANGDVLKLRIKTKCRSGDTLLLAYMATFRDVQTEPLKISVPVPSDIEITITLEQTDGTGRAFPWAVLRI